MVHGNAKQSLTILVFPRVMKGGISRKKRPENFKGEKSGAMDARYILLVRNEAYLAGTLTLLPSHACQAKLVLFGGVVKHMDVPIPRICLRRLSRSWAQPSRCGSWQYHRASGV
jgi:hypothetical protein